MDSFENPGIHPLNALIGLFSKTYQVPASKGVLGPPAARLEKALEQHSQDLRQICMTNASAASKTR